MKINQLHIRGEKKDETLYKKEETGELEVKRVYEIGTSTRGEVETEKISLGDNEFVQLEFDDGTVWLTAPDTLEEVFPEMTIKKRGVAADEVEIPTQLYSDTQERGIVKTVALKFLKILGKKSVVTPLIHDLAKKFEDKQLNVLRGLLRLKPDFSLEQIKLAGESTKPCLLFIHGTASSTTGSFDKLLNSEPWSFIQKEGTYEQVLAFEHETLTKSPLQNVFDLVEQLPQKITLHLVSHSRGGIVGDLLCRFCNGQPGVSGFSANERNYLNKCGREKDIEWIDKIDKAILSKNITIGKFVRVACPASGTTLASKRLDHLFNIVFNLLGTAIGQVANPAYLAFKDLLMAVIESKDNADALPGIEPQNPASDFIKMLNNPAPETEVNSPLIIIAGNSKASLKWQGLVVIASKLFYLDKNDLVVDTRSMYNGARRVDKKVQYFLDQSAVTSHFNYFENPGTRAVLKLALQSTGDTLIPGFSLLDQRAFTTEEVRFLGLEGGSFFRNEVSGKKPIAVLLPGIMGSNLKVKDKQVWINYWQFLTGGLRSLQFSDENNRNVQAESIVETSYKRLGDYLKDDYDIVTFPFDWRLQLNDCAKGLNNKLISLMQFGQPIKIIGHSMGGVLFRDFIINYPDTWKALNKSSGFRLLFLGSPLGGSFRIPYVVFGKDAIINKLDMIDRFHSKAELINVFNSLPGILSLLPIANDAENDFSKLSTWQKMKNAFDDKDWPLPSEKVLAEFGRYRDNIISKRDGIDYSNAVYVAGQVRPGKGTPSGYRINEGRLEFLSTKEGDESVTWATGIPENIKDDNVYYSDVTHGELANDPKLFKAISEILANGKTSLLKKTKPMSRDVGFEFVSKPDFDFDLTPQGVERSILGLDTEADFESGELPVTVSVSNGDLKYASYPVMAGHFFRDGILYAEKSIDNNLGGELSRRHRLGLYPGEIGTSEIFISEEKRGLKGAIIVGLGKQGELTEYLLMQTVTQATANYLSGYNSKVVNTSEFLARKERIGISALIIGCGFGGLDIESAVRAILQGVQNANQKIRQIYEAAKTVEEIELIELYRDRALGAVHAVGQFEKDEHRALNITWKNQKIVKRPGWRERLPVDSSNGWWTRIVVRQNFDKEDDIIKKKKGLRFTISTNAAREEERLLRADSETVSQMLEDMSVKEKWSPQTAKAIFELLIPFDFKDQVKRQSNLNWIVDKYTAAFPWELLQDSATNALPLCVNAGMIRQMATTDYRIKITSMVDDNVLVIGDPDLKNPAIQLAGAYKEGQTVADLFRERNYDTELLLRGTAAQIMLSLFSKNYKIIHLAGHGVFNTDTDKPSGMLIGKDAFLTTFEINQMSVVPELVFVNCCFLGQVNAETETFYQGRYRLAANIGTELINIGVKAVIVSGWAVDDSAALSFTEKFYDAMFDGECFGDAVRKARKKIYEEFGHRTNTWGAYQCYGDPFYTFRVVAQDKQKAFSFIISEEAEIELTNLLNQLDTGEYEVEDIATTVQKISDAVDNAGIRNGRITELEALLYSALNKYTAAIAKFETLLKEEKASFSFSASEKYCNIRAKYYVWQVKKNNGDAAEYTAKMKWVIKDIEELINFCDLKKNTEDAIFGSDSTVERLNILASAYKRLGIISGRKEMIDALGEAAKYYSRAYAVPNNRNKFYPLTNWLAIKKCLVMAGESQWGTPDDKDLKDFKWPKTNSAAIKLLEASLADLTGNSNRDEIDYWDMVAESNIKLSLVLLGDKSVKPEQVTASYMALWNYTGHKGNRQAEIEQLEFLEDALCLADNKEANALLAFVCGLKAELLRMM